MSVIPDQDKKKLGLEFGALNRRVALKMRRRKRVGGVKVKQTMTEQRKGLGSGDVGRIRDSIYHHSFSRSSHCERNTQEC